MTEFIIVGRGLAANVLAHTFYQHNISFKMIGSGGLSSCSRVAAGIWNPVVFKRLTGSWLAEQIVPFLNTFYTDCEVRLQKKLITQRPLIKPFTEDQEKALWTKKAKNGLRNFLDEKLYSQTPAELENCIIANGYGIVKQCGNLDVAAFLDASSACFKEHTLDEVFDHAELQVLPDRVRYKTTEAGQLIFCEGHLVKHNPFFSWIPLKPAKGEILTLKVPDLKFRDMIFNRNGFLMDVAPGLYKAGATYAWDDLEETPTTHGLAELREKIAQMTGAAYTVEKHESGIRPSSADRRPVIGPHPRYPRLFVFNGLGTKGVMLAPFFAENFVNFYLQKEPLDPEADITRFYPVYDNKSQN